MSRLCGNKLSMLIVGNVVEDSAHLFPLKQLNIKIFSIEELYYRGVLISNYFSIRSVFNFDFFRKRILI